MIRRVLLLLCGARFIFQEQLTLSPAYSTVLENESLQLTCHSSSNILTTQWGTVDRSTIVSYLTFSKEGLCLTVGPLNATKYYETKCYENATFIVNIKHVNRSNHGEEWYCLGNFGNKSNAAIIDVQIPPKYVKFEHVPGHVIEVVEKTSTRLTCETSEGRPAANVTWIKVSRTERRTDITHDLKYNISKKETVTEGNLTTVRSSIDIELMREDNGSHIICEAAIPRSKGVRKELLIHVQYPPSKPTFVVDKGKVNCRDYCLTPEESVSVLCESDSYPPPIYFWNSTGRSKYGQYLYLPNIVRNETWQCTATNNMMLPNQTLISRKSFAMLSIYPLRKKQFCKTCVPLIAPGFDITANISSKQNGTVTFKFQAIAYPKLIFQWFKLSGSSWKILESSGEFTIDTIDSYSNLTVRSISKYNYGKYKLRIQNGIGTLEQIYFLKPDGPIMLSTTTHTVFSALHSDVTLQYKVTDFFDEPDNFVFTWHRETLLLPNDGKKYVLSSHGFQSNLFIRNIVKADFGQYRVLIRNSYGSKTHFITLREEAKEQESVSARITFVAVGALCSIGAVVSVYIAYKYFRSKRRVGQLNVHQLEVNDEEFNRTATGDNENDVHYHEINDLYDELNEQLIDRTAYLEMQSIRPKSEDSNKYYITPTIR